MVDIQKQALSVLPIKQESNINIIYGKDWYMPIKKLWGKKKVNRYIFIISNEDKNKLFECNVKLAAKIIGEVNRTIDNAVDNSKIKKINIDIKKLKSSYKVNVTNTNIPKISNFSKFINKIKRFFSVNKIKELFLE